MSELNPAITLDKYLPEYGIVYLNRYQYARELTRYPSTKKGTDVSLLGFHGYIRVL